ncbi:MAG: type 3 dihydrofolate reductase [Gammaproteobacteria bacterium]|nr:type 3 dihydrofolate reductase [Gammaproteobacteria bacterium]
MIISLIAAMGRNREIGKDNALLWRLPNDMRWFVGKTRGKPIIMGRKTFESFGAKPLPNRLNIVVTRDQHYAAEGAEVVHSIDAALAAAQSAEEVMVIGGAEFYKQLLPVCNRLYLTYVDGLFDADAYFPDFDQREWQESFSEYHDVDKDHAFSYRFVILDKPIH